MTQERTPPAVEVNVHVTVTIPGGPAAVAHSATGRPTVSVLDSVPITVTKPPLGGSGVRTGQVWFDVCTLTSYICATGGLIGSACCVLAKVYPGNTVFDPNNPPAVPVGDPGLRCTAVDNSSSSFPWQFVKPTGNLLPVPTAIGSGANYILAVWVKFDGQSTYTFRPFPFVGVNSNQTDCDGSGGPLLAVGFPVHSASAPPTHPVLTGALRDKSGRFAALPDEASFAWDASQGGWVWAPAPAHCGTFTLLPCKDSFVLHGTVSEPAVVAPRTGGSLKPLQLTFEVRAQGGKGQKNEGFVLDVREGGAAPAGHS